MPGFCSQGTTRVFGGQEDGGSQQPAAHETTRGDYYTAIIGTALCYPFVSGGTQNYKQQPLLKSVDLYFGEIAEWKLLLVPYVCKKVLNLLTSKAKRFAYGDFGDNQTLKTVFVFPNALLCSSASLQVFTILCSAAFH